MTWKHPSSPVTKKFKVQRSVAKVMATVFWDAKGVILLDILPQGQCINAARYCSTLDRLKEAIRRKRPGLLRRGVVLQHDNATPHSANLTQQWLQRYGWEILPHPAHSPDLASSDFHLFEPLKRQLGGMAFKTEDDLISELRNWFDNLDVDFFRIIGTLTLDEKSKVEYKGGDARSGFKFDLDTPRMLNNEVDPHAPRRQSSFRAKKSCEREIWKAYVEGISKARVSDDVDLLPGQIKEIQDRLGIYFAAKLVASTSLPPPPPPAAASGSKGRRRSEPEAVGTDRLRFDSKYSSDSGCYPTQAYLLPNSPPPQPPLPRVASQDSTSGSFSPARQRSASEGVKRPIFHLGPGGQEPPSWFFNNCSRQQAEEILRMGSHFGNTLMRSKPDDVDFAISKMVEVNGTVQFSHFRVQCQSNGYRINVENPIYDCSGFSSWFFNNCSRQQAEEILRMGSHFGNTLMRSKPDDIDFAISKMVEVNGNVQFSHFRVQCQSNGYRINVENPNRPVRTLSEVMKFFVEMSRQTARPMTCNNLERILYADDGNPYNTVIADVNTDTNTQIDSELGDQYVYPSPLLVESEDIPSVSAPPPPAPHNPIPNYLAPHHTTARPGQMNRTGLGFSQDRSRSVPTIPSDIIAHVKQYALKKRDNILTTAPKVPVKSQTIDSGPNDRRAGQPLTEQPGTANELAEVTATVTKRSASIKKQGPEVAPKPTAGGVVSKTLAALEENSQGNGGTDQSSPEQTQTCKFSLL
ncbi:histone-lysine N-methyltransferase SETMAR [Plakobranchus ocellatus]|uniref:Histone-lysine N-methyltransferase SETMAR n=1 Tax=Plakobranchus ocellatus TaxID=259542 RepID=A0AAV4DBE9_9GAST|nr:histone-lysine N-methyltransferase SETMAR [Plakobranchus ocellatus]